MTGLGARGEDLAVRHLKKKGYRVLMRNYRSRVGEIDIIAEDGETLVFVEVKTRTDDTFGHPMEAVDARKQKKIRSAALSYLAGRRVERRTRFDIVSVHFRDGKGEVELLKDAFEVNP